MTASSVHVVDPVAAATYFVQVLGCTAFPVWGSRRGKCLCGDPHDGTRKHGPDNVGKHPATDHGFKDATDDLARIRTFLANPGTPNYGLNAPPGVLVIDVDGADGLARWTELERLHGALPVTFTTLTANGRHYFFRWPETAGPMPTGKLFGYVIRRHDDGYVIGPGSVHPSGTVYDTLRQPSGMPYDIAELPAGWATAARESKPATTFTVGQSLPTVGERHDWLRNTARLYAGTIRDPSDLKAALMSANAKLPQPKTEAEVDRAIGAVLSRFAADPTEPDPETGAPIRAVEEELELLGAPTSGEFPEPPGNAAFDGLLGELVDDLADGTDASLTGLLGSLIAFSGALLPGHAYFHREQTSSPFIALVGESSVGRKGTAMIRAMDAFSNALEKPTVHRVVMDGINSGEGLVSTLYYRREHFGTEPTVGLVFEEEYAGLLASRGREGSTLDPKMRQAFDGSPLSNRRSGGTQTVMPPYWLPALIGITPDELRHRLEPGALQSGSANRWLYLPVTRREITPSNATPTFDPEHRTAIVEAHRAAQRNPLLLDVDPAVTRTLAEYADFLPRTSYGLSRDLTRRLGVIAFRVALVHALVERSVRVTSAYLDRAIALTEYARRGIAWVFGTTIGNPDANLLERNLVVAGRLRHRTITRQLIRDPIRRQAAIDELLRLGWAEVLTVQTGGRSRTELVATAEKGAFVPFGHVLDMRTPSDAENLDKSLVASVPKAGQKPAKSLPEGGQKVPEVGTDKELDKSWTEGSPEDGQKLDKSPDWVSPCHFYQEHQMAHHLTAAGWVCSICSKEGSQ